MFSIWILLLAVMADVVPGYHGGDGAGDPPPPSGWGRGTHEEDAVPPTRRRGKAKNTKLDKRIRQQGGPLSMEFDRDVTFTPVGDINDLFTREVGMYMWHNMAFDSDSWEKVDPAERNALNEHLASKFNFNEVENDRESRQLKGGIKAVLQKRYRDRKSNAKKHFDSVGGYENIDSAMANPPEGMQPPNWLRTINHFLSESYRGRSSANKQNRGKQQVVNRGGTATYSSFCHKQEKSRLEAYGNAHTLRDGTWDCEQSQQNYAELNRRLAYDDCGMPPPNEPAVFEDVLGSRRGHYRGIGRKPSSSAAPLPQQTYASTQMPLEVPPPPSNRSVTFRDPDFLYDLTAYMGVANKSKVVNEEESEDDE